MYCDFQFPKNSKKWPVLDAKNPNFSKKNALSRQGFLFDFSWSCQGGLVFGCLFLGGFYLPHFCPPPLKSTTTLCAVSLGPKSSTSLVRCDLFRCYIQGGNVNGGGFFGWFPDRNVPLSDGKPPKCLWEITSRNAMKLRCHCGAGNYVSSSSEGLFPPREKTLLAEKRFLHIFPDFESFPPIFFQPALSTIFSIFLDNFFQKSLNQYIFFSALILWTKVGVFGKIQKKCEI